MLKDRVLSTLKFFDLQDYPLTLLELHKFLLADTGVIKTRINTQWELIVADRTGGDVTISQLAQCLDAECRDEMEQRHGFYCLKGRSGIIDARLANYLFGIVRERRIRRFAKGLRLVPFVRGVALAGSQAMGLQKKDSDIDLLIIVDPKFLWLGRTLVTAYFQLLGSRRHGKKIANRFCLNHYLAGVKSIGELKNLYTAWEYAKLRPLVYGEAVAEFQQKNRNWIAAFFPNFEPLATPSLPGQKTRHLPGNGGELREFANRASLQTFLEQILSGSLGQWLESKLKNWQLPKIRQEEFILVRDDELSFHPQSKQRELLQKFFIS